MKFDFIIKNIVENVSDEIKKIKKYEYIKNKCIKSYNRTCYYTTLSLHF